ncbi:MAG: 23S rRNA (pseudouridine(1915)-N(3))-methyltransferase RlmH [Candidatus Limiplasma sp.]|nr:23S rRNA (pseudouridine(1915)-N(3))-methyltransferase RlmH [Candidatus Limiplasma sp.]MEA5145110.1 23S rRNA (pseudouridine(1915)-N(3))-methyltransferase RlmH [Candidatus Limiplasma sp.]
MGLSIHCVGKLRERFYADAAAEYVKRLSSLTPCAMVEVPDEPEPKQRSDAAAERVLRAEGERMLARIPTGAYVIALCVDAKQPTSEDLAQKLSQLMISGRSEIAFVIGGSLGLHGSVLARADERMGMSRMTFPHQLARVMLLEQLYRAAKINAGHRYHK